MPEQEKIFIEKPTGHRCFACGTDNPIGLNLQFYCLGDEVCSDISLGANYARVGEHGPWRYHLGTP